jgi:hypothetical protein
MHYNIPHYNALQLSQGSSVKIMTGYGLDGPDSIPGMARFFFTVARQALKLTDPI